MTDKKGDGNYWIRSGAINLIQNGLSVLLGLGSFMLLVRILDKNEYGAWTIFMGTITFMELFRNGLVQNAMIKYLASAEIPEKKKILTSSLAISASITFISILLIIPLGPFFSHIYDYPPFKTLMYLYAIVFLLSGIQNIMNGTELANFSFKGNFYSNTTRQSIFFIYVAYCYFSNITPSLQNLLYVQIFSVVICTCIAYAVTRRYLMFDRKIDKNWVVKLLNFGKYSFGTSISASLAGNIDQWMLGGMLSKSAAASYNLAIRITNLVDIPTNAMATIVFPQGAKRMESEGISAIKYLYEKSVGSILAILVPALLFMYLFGDWVIHFLAGAKYNDSLPLLKVTLIFCIFIPYGRQVGTIFESIGQAKTNFFLVLVTATTNILLNFFFIKYFGVIGAAYATLIANIIGFILSQYILHRKFNINWINPWYYAWQFYPELYKKLFSKKSK